MTTIVTEQAPTAKPVGVYVLVGTSDVVLIDVPDYDIPTAGFGGGRRIALGVAEISSPLLLCNYSTVTTSVTLELVRADPAGTFAILKDYALSAKQTELIPLNGQFLLSGDILRIRAANSDRVSAALSYTVGQAEEDDVT